MSTETEKLKLFKWDTSNEIDLESDFDIEKTLNENWDKIDDNTEQVSKKNIEQDNSISELQEEIENLRNISNIMPSVNSQGENITLNNTANNVRFRKFKVGGNSEQETREGYNLLNANLPYTTSSSGNTIKWLGKENIPKMEVNKYYYLHGKFSDGTIFSGAHAAFVIIDSMGQILNKTFGSSFQNTVDISNATDCYIYTDSTYVNKTVTEVAIYEGKENKAYEQHGASPSPDYQSPIKTVGNNVNLANLGEKAQYTSSGFTVSWKDSVFKMSGTASTNLTIPANVTGVNAINLGNFKAGTYTVSKKILNGNVVNAKGSGIYLRSSNGMIASIYIASTKDRASFTLTEDTNIYIYVFIDSGTQYSDLEIGIKIVEGTEVGEYSKYGQGSTKIVKCNTNLYDGKNEVGGINNDGSLSSTTDRWRTINYINVKSLKNLIIRVYDIEKSGALGRYCLYDDKYNFLSSVQILNTQTDLKVDNASYLKFWFLNEKVASSAQVQVEEGTTAKKYNQHEEQSYIMPVQNEMLEGDYFDLANEEEVHGWKKIILNGTENWQLYSAGTNISRRFGLALTENVPLKETEKYGKGYSTHFKITQFINEDLSIFLQVEPNNWYIAVTDANLKWSSIVEFKSWLKVQYDVGTPVIIYYKTAIEKRIAFTDEQKAVAKEIQKATSYEDTTHIYSTDEVSPVFDVEAVADIRKLITNISTTAEGER